MTRDSFHMRRTLSASVLATAGLLLAGFATPPARAGGTPENALIVVDPASKDGLYIANYYKAARGIPDQNILYFTPGATNINRFVELNIPALLGTLTNRQLADHIDYVIVAPGGSYYISTPGLIGDQCYPVSRLSIGSGYTVAHMASMVVGGGLDSTLQNGYYNLTAARAFDSQTRWYNGAPSSVPQAQQYFIGAMLGYTGNRGNTLSQILALIDRSVAVDGTRPTGTFYFMNHTADPPRNVRAPQYSTAEFNIEFIGGQAQILDGPLPYSHSDCLGVMTGFAGYSIATADLNIRPGAFGDHLTSFAGDFDNASQTKMSEWITKGVSGTWGAVEEPCNYTGKFPNAKMHFLYYSGSSLGEAALRSAEYVAFQLLLYGDPLTRPWTHIPAVSVPDAPAGTISGVVSFTPEATTTHPTAAIIRFELLIDGVLQGTVTPGDPFNFDTTLLADGWHELRVLAYDNTLLASVGSWTGQMTVDNAGRAVSINANVLNGNLATAFGLTVASAQAGVNEVRVVQNERVVAAAPGSNATLTVYGRTFGSGPVRVQGEALFSDGTRVRSAPLELDVSTVNGTPTASGPIAYGYTKFVRTDAPAVIELPATFDDANAPILYELIALPAQATVPTGQASAAIVIQPFANAQGHDTLRFSVVANGVHSAQVDVTIVYDWFQAGDVNCDGGLDFADINAFVLALLDPGAYGTTYPECDIMTADVSGDGAVGFEDINPFVALLLGPQ